MKKIILLLFLLILPTIKVNAVIIVDGIQYEYEMNYVGGSQKWEYKLTVVSRKEKYSGDIVIPSSVKFTDVANKYVEGKVVAIGDGAFNSCKDLTSVTIPSSVTSIGISAFRACSSLKNISLPDGITIIESSIFEDCIALTDITIPSGITTIKSFTFRNCRNLTSVIIPSTVKEIGWEAFYGCESLSSISIPNSVEKIGWNAFEGCTSLTSIIIGNGISEIGDEAFSSCSQLREIYCYANMVPKTDKNSFENTNIKNVFLYVPSSSIVNYESTTPWKDFKKIVAIGSKPVYKIIYMIDGKEHKTVEYEIGADITPEPAPDGDYKSFEWDNLPQIMPEHDVIVNAKYAFNKYTLTYMLDGEVYKTVDYEYGAEIVPESNPNSWYDTFEWENLPTTMPKEDVTVYAKYTLAKYVLTYMIDGEEYRTIKYEYGATIDEEPAPDGDYKSFEWENLPQTMPDHEVIVNAKYTINKYTLTYILDGEVFKTTDYEFGAEIDPEPIPHFWYDSFEWENLPTTMPKENVTVYAKYTLTKYKLTYMIDGEEYKTIEYEYGATIDEEPAPDGGYKSFKWENLPQTMPSHDVIVNAKYTINEYTLTYMLDGEVFKTEEYEYGAEIDPEPKPHSWYDTFEWENLPITMPKEDVTVYAKYTLAKYVLTYMIDGEEYKTIEYEYGATIDEEPVPDGDYNSFKWVGVPSTMPDHDVVVKASYTKPPKPFKMIISLKNGEEVTFALSDKPEVTLTGERFVVNSTSNTIDCLRSDIVDFHFEEIATSVVPISYTGQDEIKVYDMSGHEVATHRGSLSEAKIKLNSYRPGLYIIKVGNKVTIKYLKK